MKKPFFGLILLALVVLLPGAVSAQTRQSVLGASTSSATLSLPPTTEGPGLFLPDSPFYFLDMLKQQVRLFFAFTPEEKVQTYMSIAGERMAEVRFELQKGNSTAAEVALQGLKDNTKAAATLIAQQKFAGNDMTTTAEIVNETIKRRQQDLDMLDTEATGGFKAEVDAADAALTDAKIQVEDSLPQALLQREIQYDMTRDVTRNLVETTRTAAQVSDEVSFLEQEASKTANLATISGKIQDEHAQDDLLKQALQSKVQSEVQEITEKAQTAAAAFATLQNTSATPKPTE